MGYLSIVAKIHYHASHEPDDSRAFLYDAKMRSQSQIASFLSIQSRSPQVTGKLPVLQMEIGSSSQVMGDSRSSGLLLSSVADRW